MACYNRKSQTIETLKGFEKMYAGKYIFEVIIVDDNYNGVATLLDGYLDAGEYRLTWDATHIQNGNYRIIADLGTKQCFINMNKDTN